MKTPSLFLLLLLFLFSCLAGTASDTDGTERINRAKLAAELRLAYAGSQEYNPYDRTYNDHTKAATIAHKDGDLTKAIHEIQSGLKYSKYDINMLMFLSTLYHENGEEQKAEENRLLWTSLLDSIFDSGTGRDPATAFKVINVAEEYAVIGILRLEVVKQSLRIHDTSQFDVLEVKNPNSGETFELFFNVDLPKQWLTRHLQFETKK